MATSPTEDTLNSYSNYITSEDIQLIISNFGYANERNIVLNYTINAANDKMLGFMAEYLKVTVHLTNQKVIYVFVKAISKTNLAKAEMLKEMKLFEKEMIFHSKIRNKLEVPGLDPWSPRLIALLKDAMVFEDLISLQYKVKNKFERFDVAHTLQALKTLARFHASSVIFEANKSKEINAPYTVNDDYKHALSEGGYHNSSDWYIQCMTGALEAIKVYSKYNTTEINLIDSHWSNIWSTALDLSDFHPNQTNVICHRDLWNNNIMFHYESKDSSELVPDNCLFVDFQAVRYQPPASDVMALLCCNLEPTFRHENIDTFLNFYYTELQAILLSYNIELSDMMTKEEFLTSAEKQTKWGLVVCACLLPQFWLDDDLTTKIFSDNEQFNEILTKNKGLFIKKMMANNSDYRSKSMEIFEEIVKRYCFTGKETT